MKQIPISTQDITDMISGNCDTADALWQGKPIGRIAVSVAPNAARLERVASECVFDLDRSVPRPAQWNERWEQALIDELCRIVAQMQLPGDYCPTINVPRFVHGQSQGIADLFGARVEEQPDGNYFVHPLEPDPAVIDSVAPRAIETSMYWGAVEWLKYARDATFGSIPFRNPVMTGPFDTANYLLGTATLLEWTYTEPAILHRLLDKITDVIVSMVATVMEAAGGIPHACHLQCTRGGFDLCSEMRSIVSKDLYEVFEAPYLVRIGEKLGAFGVHSCGSWERTIPSVLANPAIRAMNGQIKENDLQQLCNLTDGRLALSIGPSVNLDSRYTWAHIGDFYRHILSTVPSSQPFEVVIPEDDLPLWQDLHKKLRGVEYALPPPRMGSR